MPTSVPVWVVVVIKRANKDCYAWISKKSLRNCRDFGFQDFKKNQAGYFVFVATPAVIIRTSECLSNRRAGKLP